MLSVANSVRGVHACNKAVEGCIYWDEAVRTCISCIDKGSGEKLGRWLEETWPLARRRNKDELDLGGRVDLLDLTYAWQTSLSAGPTLHNYRTFSIGSCGHKAGQRLLLGLFNFYPRSCGRK